MLERQQDRIDGDAWPRQPRPAVMPLELPAPSGAQFEHSLQGVLRTFAHVIGQDDFVAPVDQRVAHAIERDHLHVTAELARLVEMLVGNFHQQAVGKPAFGHDEKFVGRDFRLAYRIIALVESTASAIAITSLRHSGWAITTIPGTAARAFSTSSAVI